MKQFMVATFTDLILRVCLAWGFSRTALGSVGIWMSWPIGWGIAFLLSYWFYKNFTRTQQPKITVHDQNKA